MFEGRNRLPGISVAFVVIHEVRTQLPCLLDVINIHLCRRDTLQKESVNMHFKDLGEAEWLTHVIHVAYKGINRPEGLTL